MNGELDYDLQYDAYQRSLNPEEFGILGWLMRVIGEGPAFTRKPT